MEHMGRAGAFCSDRTRPHPAFAGFKTAGDEPVNRERRQAHLARSTEGAGEAAGVEPALHHARVLVHALQHARRLEGEHEVAVQIHKRLRARVAKRLPLVHHA